MNKKKHKVLNHKYKKDKKIKKKCALICDIYPNFMD